MKINKKEYSMGGYNELASALKAYAEGGMVGETDPKKTQLGAATVTAEKPKIPTRDVMGWDSEESYNKALSFYDNLRFVNPADKKKMMAQIPTLLQQGRFEKAHEVARQFGARLPEGVREIPESFDGFGTIGYASWNESMNRAEMVSPEEAAQIERIMKENPDSPAAKAIKNTSYIKNPFGDYQWNR